jgi:hypothetical protein
MTERTERAHQPDNRANLPSPEQIEAAVAEIRAGWSKAEYAKRAGVGFAPWNLGHVGGGLSAGGEEARRLKGGG